MEKNPDIIFDKSVQTKMLILFVLSRCHKPVMLDTLTELALCDERISYFDVTDCIHRLVKSKHLYLTDCKYTLTDKGLRNSKVLEADLPHSVRVKAEQAALRINNSQSRDSMIVTRHSACESGGFDVALSLADGVSEILSITLHAASKQQAAKLEKGFRRNAHTLYRDVVELITQKSGDKK